MKSKFLYISMASLILAGSLSSCNDKDEYFEDDAQGTRMEIKKVYLEDYKSSVPDREVEFARLGQMLRLEGSGFYGVKKVYINGYDTYFNRAYVSDNSMIVSIHRDTPVSDCPDDVRNTIRLVKDGGNETVYTFLIRNGYSTIQNVSCTLPMPGDVVKVTGQYLHETNKITLPGGVVVTDGIVNDENGEWYTFVMPSGVTEGGALISESPNGVTQSPAYFNEKRGLLIDFDTDGQQGSWGSSNKDDDGNIKAGVSMIYPEDCVEDPLNSGRGKCVPIVPLRLLDEGGVPSGKPRASECHTVGDGNKAWEDWSRMTDLIPAETPVTEVAIQVDVYCPQPWTGTGQLQMQLINNYNFAGIGSDDDGKNNLVYCFAPYLSKWTSGDMGTFQTDGWQTLTFPLSVINKYATLIDDTESETPTFQMVIDDRNAATYPNFAFGFVNTDFDYKNGSGETVTLVSTLFQGPAIYLDNWRVVPYKLFTPSDYEEPEEDEE